MKTCEVCGREIVNGRNGCTYLGRICFDCHGGAPRYPAPVAVRHEYTEAEVNAAEARLLHDDEGLR